MSNIVDAGDKKNKGIIIYRILLVSDEHKDHSNKIQKQPFIPKLQKNMDKTKFSSDSQL